MSTRGSHAGKTAQQKEAYGRYIKGLDYEPTLEESIDFGSTEKGGEELSESTSKRQSRGYTKKLLREHFKEHWSDWLIGGLLLIGLFLINESRITTAVMDSTLNDTSAQIKNINNDINKLEEKVEQVKINSILNSKDIEYLKKD